MSDQEEDDRIRRGIGHIFSPDWAHKLGDKLGQGIRQKLSDPTREAAKAAAKRYIQWVNPAAAQAAQDEEIAANKERIRVMEQYARPRDLGDIDAPIERPPVQMQREFSNEKEKEEYLDRIRLAQKNAASK